MNPIVPAEGSKQKHYRVWLLMAVGLGILMNPLNTTMISVAFMRIQQHFAIGFAEISWLVASYYIISAIIQPTMGKLSDRFGRKKFFVLGLLLIGLSSMAAPLSPDFTTLMVARMVQAAGAATLQPAGLGIVRMYVSERQTRALGVLAVFTSTSAAFGPTIGGYLIHAGDWQAIFWINYPIIFVSLLLALLVMPNDDKRQRPSDKVDAVGMLFFGGLLTLWMLLLMSWGNGWPLRAVVPGTALAAVLTFVFYRHQLRPAAPFIDVRFLRANTAVCEIYAQYILVNAIHYSVLFGFPDYLQHERMMDARQAGWMMLFVAGFSLVLTPFIARWIERAGVKRPQLTGSVVMLCGTASMLTLHEQSSWLHMGAVLSLMGVSNGFHQLCLQTALYQEVPQSQTGAASGLFMTSRFVGTMLSASFLSLVFGGGTTMDGLHSLACICIILSIGVLVMSYRMRHSSYGEPAP